MQEIAVNLSRCSKSTYMKQYKAQVQLLIKHGDKLVNILPISVLLFRNVVDKLDIEQYLFSLSEFSGNRS